MKSKFWGSFADERKLFNWSMKMLINWHIRHHEVDCWINTAENLMLCRKRIQLKWFPYEQVSTQWNLRSSRSQPFSLPQLPQPWTRDTKMNDTLPSHGVILTTAYQKKKKKPYLCCYRQRLMQKITSKMSLSARDNFKNGLTGCIKKKKPIILCNFPEWNTKVHKAYWMYLKTERPFDASHPH